MGSGAASARAGAMAASLRLLVELGLPVVHCAPLALSRAQCGFAAVVTAAPIAKAPATRAAREMAPANALAPAAAAALVASAAADGEAAGGQTRPLWLEDTYAFEATAKLVSAVMAEGKLKVVVDQTIFHPQGGGQPTDVGRIIADGLPPLTVSMVSLDKASGLVHHECSADSLEPWAAASSGTPLKLCVDEAVRRRSAQIHSAGHLIDAAVGSAGFAWVPGKGYHFPDGAYVEYVMTAEEKAGVNKDTALVQINDALQALLANPTTVKVELREGVRTVEMEKTACPCGGTHVKNTSELGSVTVKALKAKGTNMRVSYVVA